MAFRGLELPIPAGAKTVQQKDPSLTRAGQTAKSANPAFAVVRIALGALPILAAACAIVFVRTGLGFRFPVPWPDETGFVAPAFDFVQHLSFFDPGMNPDRVVMWMPPGYMLLLAAVFRVIGYSFATARWVSTLACLTALGASVTLAFRVTAAWTRVAACWTVSAAFLSPFMLVSSNIARMEMAFAATILAALMCAVSGRLYATAAVLLLAALVHFNAVYFLPALALLAATACWRRRLAWPSRADWFAIGCAVLAWAAYGIYVAFNWPGFQADMAFQFALKRYIGFGDNGHFSTVLAAAIALAAFAALRLRLDARAALPLFGAGFVAMARQGHELWYDYGYMLGFALITLGLLAQAPQDKPGRRAGPVAAALAAFAMIPFLDLRIDDGIRALLPTQAMLQREVVPPADITKVRHFIAGLPPGSTVNFGWSGMEPFFLTDLARAGARWIIIRHSVTQVWPLRKADWRVVCDSSEIPPALFRFDIDHPRKGADSGCVIYPG